MEKGKKGPSSEEEPSKRKLRANSEVHYISLEEAASRIKMHPDSLRKLVLHNNLFVHKHEGRNLFVHSNEIEREAAILNNPAFLTGKEVQEELDITQGMYHSYIRLGTLKPITPPKLNYHWKFYRYSKEDVLVLKENREWRKKQRPNCYKKT